MKKQVLVITTSLRPGSNSDMLAEAFARGAREAGHEVACVSLKGKTLGFCKGCLACQTTHRCAIRDDAAALTEQMGKADVIAFVTPVYYYEMSGQMKTLLDRANPLYGADYAFRDIYLLATAAEAEASTIEGAVKGLEGWIACFEKARLAGTVFAGGVNDAGDIEGQEALQRAAEASKNL